MLAQNNVPVKDSVKLIIARVAHETNRAIKTFYGEDSVPAWNDCDKQMRSRALLGVDKVIACRDITPPDIHKQWVDTMLADGWRHGPVLDTIKKLHPNMVDYTELSDVQKLKDVVYLAVVKTLLQD